MIYELRTYTLKPGMQPTVAKNAGTVGRDIRGDDYGKLEGYWMTEIGPLLELSEVDEIGIGIEHELNHETHGSKSDDSHDEDGKGGAAFHDRTFLRFPSAREKPAGQLDGILPTFVRKFARRLPTSIPFFWNQP